MKKPIEIRKIRKGPDAIPGRESGRKTVKKVGESLTETGKRMEHFIMLLPRSFF